MKENKNFRLSVKILIFALLIIVLSESQAVADLYPMKPINNRPEGWSGITWGALPQNLGNGLKFLGEIPEFGEQYIVENELSSFGNTKIKETKYYFKDNKFTMLEFTFKRSQGKEILRNAVEKFGPPQLNGINDDIFSWIDDEICIYLNFEFHWKQLWNQLGIMRYVLRSSSNAEIFPKFPLKPIPNKIVLTDFLDIKFNDSIKKIREELLFVRDNQEKDIEIYRKKVEEIISLDDMKVKEVHYWFLRSKLFLVNIIFDETAKKERIKEYLISKFGVPASISQDENIFQWYEGNVFAISMGFNLNGNGGELLYGLFGLLD
jgi:hypothetical protein